MIPLFFLTIMQLTCSNQSVNTVSGQIQANTILKSLSKGENLVYRDAEIEGVLDFTELDAYLAGPGLLLSDVEGSLSFFNCTFKDGIRGFQSEEKNQKRVRFLKNLSFIQCKVQAEVDLRFAEITGPAFFSGSYFQETVSLEGCVFRGAVMMDKAVFAKDLKMQQCHFQSNTSFMDANFGELCSFQGAQFDRDAQFGVAEFHGYADFSRTHFLRGAFFNYAKFFDRAVFNTSSYRDRAEFMSARFEKSVEWRNIVFYGQARFNESRLEDAASFENSRFLFGKPDMDQVVYLLPEKITFENTVYTESEPMQKPIEK
jgi:uncharacterized protein YjbI with pentapeptide repeats